MGFFQVGAIIILTLQVKQKYTESMESISFWLYFGITVWSCLIVLGVSIFMVYVAKCVAKDGDVALESECYNATRVGILLNALCFAVLSLSLIFTMIPLCSSLKTLQSGRMELTKGVMMLFAVFTIFTFCYVTRTLYDIFVDANLDFGNALSGVCLPCLWDGLPIFLMFAYHFQNLRIMQALQKKPNYLITTSSQSVAFLASSEEDE